MHRLSEIIMHPSTIDTRALSKGQRSFQYRLNFQMIKYSNITQEVSTLGIIVRHANMKLQKEEILTYFSKAITKKSRSLSAPPNQRTDRYDPGNLPITRYWNVVYVVLRILVIHHACMEVIWNRDAP